LLTRLFNSPQTVQVFIYLSAAVPNHSYKLAACWYRPVWYGRLLAPAIYSHWGVLIFSQGYYFTHCACSVWGCFYPAAMLMVFGAWAMALWDLPNFIDAIIHTNS